jgi:hypothetical protein
MNIEEKIEKYLNEGAVPSKDKPVLMRHKTSSKEVSIVPSGIEKYKKMGYVVVNEEMIEEAVRFKVGDKVKTTFSQSLIEKLRNKSGVIVKVMNVRPPRYVVKFDPPVPGYKEVDFDPANLKKA